MTLWDTEPLDVRPLLHEERTELVTLLSGLTPEQWAAPTVCPGWAVKDVALHILDDDFGWLARNRDGDMSGFLRGFDDYRTFVAVLNAKNERWIQAARGLSPRLITDLLAFVGEQMDAWWASLPHHYRSLTGPDADVLVRFDGTGGGVWTLARRAGQWDLREGRPAEPMAAVAVPAADAWRLFTGALSDPVLVHQSGDPALTSHFAAARGIIM